MSDQNQNGTNGKKLVPWFIFVWTVGIATALMLGLFGMQRSLATKVEQVDQTKQQIFIELTRIQTDLKNLDLRLTELKADLQDR